MLILTKDLKWKILKDKSLYIKTITFLHKMCDADKVEDDKIKLIQKKILKDMDGL